MLYHLHCMMNPELGITMYQAFTGKRPDISKFRTFRCKVYAKVADTQRQKLDPKGQIGIYLGPEVNGPGYIVLVFDPELKRKFKYAIHTTQNIDCNHWCTG